MRHSRAIKEVLRDARVARDGKFVYYYIEEKIGKVRSFLGTQKLKVYANVLKERFAYACFQCEAGKVLLHLQELV